MTFTSCYNYQSLKLLQENRQLPVYQPSKYSDYKIRINDELIYRLITSDETVSNFISPQSGNSNGQGQITYRVYTDGTIDIPFMDSIKVVGLTLTLVTGTLLTVIAQVAVLA